MRVWRIYDPTHVTSPAAAMTGAGAARRGGRWNSPGHFVVYTAESLSLATLEVSVHLDEVAIAAGYARLPIVIADELILSLDRSDLPDGWDERAYNPVVSQRIGDNWLAGQDSVALAVPSVIVPVEHNVLLNPNHPEFKRIRLGKPEPLNYDPRIKAS